MTTMSKHSRTIFVGDLSAFCTEADLYQGFLVFGEIENVKMIKNKNNLPVGYGFITFMEVDACQNALRMDGTIFLGKQIKVSKAFYRQQIQPVLQVPQQQLPVGFMSNNHNKQDFEMMIPSNNAAGNSSSPSSYGKMDGSSFSAMNPSNNNGLQTAQVHFSFVSHQNQFIVNEGVIRNIFRQFGDVKDICFKKSVPHKECGGQSGYGFVHYPMTPDGIAAAIQSTHVLCQIVIDQVLYDCCLTHQLETFLQKNYSSFASSQPLMSKQKKNSNNSTMMNMMPPVSNNRSMNMTSMPTMMMPMNAATPPAIIPPVVPPAQSVASFSFPHTPTFSSASTPVENQYYSSGSMSGSSLSTPSNHPHPPPHLMHNVQQIIQQQQQQHSPQQQFLAAPGGEASRVSSRSASISSNSSFVNNNSVPAPSTSPQVAQYSNPRAYYNNHGNNSMSFKNLNNNYNDNNSGMNDYLNVIPPSNNKLDTDIGPSASSYDFLFEK